MSIKERVSSEQWKVLFNAPFAASTFVSSASGGGLDMIKEVITAGKFMQELAAQSGGSGYGELVDDLLEAIKGMSPDDAKDESYKYEGKDLESVRSEAKQVVAEGVGISANLPGAEGYKRWILDMARKVAETKTGGFLGIGAKAIIDEREQAAIDELADLIR